MVANLYSKKPLYQYARDLILASREAIYARGHFPREPDEVTDVRSQLMNLSISMSCPSSTIPATWLTMKDSDRIGNSPSM